MAKLELHADFIVALEKKGMTRKSIELHADFLVALHGITAIQCTPTEAQVILGLLDDARDVFKKRCSHDNKR